MIVDDSLVFRVLTALKRGSTQLIIGSCTMNMTYKDGQLRLISPVDHVLTHLFKLVDEKKYESDNNVYVKLYRLEDKAPVDLTELLVYYKMNYL